MKKYIQSDEKSKLLVNNTMPGKYIIQKQRKSSGKQKLREFIAIRLVLSEMLKVVSPLEAKG